MADPEIKTITIDGCTVAYARKGSGPPLVYLGPGSAAGWQIGGLEQLSDSFDVIAPDHPGFGRSDTPKWLHEIGDLAYFYLDFLAALDLDGVHLVGSCTGGWIAAEIAVRNTGRLASLTLVGAAGIHLKGVAKADPFLWTPEQRIRNLFVDQSIAEDWLEAAEGDEESDRILKDLAATVKLCWQPPFFSRRLPSWLHRIDVPSLVMWGDADKRYPVAYAEAWRDMIPGARLEIVAGCGHLPEAEKPDQFARTVSAFATEARP